MRTLPFLQFVLLVCILFWIGCNRPPLKNDGLKSEMADVVEDDVYQISFSGIKINWGMTVDEIKQINTDCRIEKKKTPGYNSMLRSAESFTYYDVYSPANDRTCIIVPRNNNSAIRSITFLTDDYKTPENISIESSWGDLEETYPNGEWLFVYWDFDFYTNSYYQTWIYYYVPSIHYCFVFKGSQFTETQMEALYNSVSEDVLIVSSIPSSIYSTIRSSVKIYQLIAMDNENIEQEKKESEDEIVVFESNQSPENVAKKFCIAVYQNDMAKAKSYMTIEDAKRTPDNMQLSEDECQLLMKKLNNASFKIVNNEFTDKIVTVRFFDPDLEYLSKNNRWFCCAIELANANGTWEVINYGY